MCGQSMTRTEKRGEGRVVRGDVFVGGVCVFFVVYPLGDEPFKVVLMDIPLR